MCLGEISSRDDPEFKIRKWLCGIPLLMKLSLHHKQDDSEKKTTFIQVICHKLEKRRADLFQDYPNAIHFCPSMLLFPFAVLLLCCSTVLGGYCNVSSYF